MNTKIPGEEEKNTLQFEKNSRKVKKISTPYLTWRKAIEKPGWKKSNHTDIDLSGLFLQGALQQIKSFSSKNLNQNERKVKSEETSQKTWYALD